MTLTNEDTFRWQMVFILYYQKYTGKNYNITVLEEQINNCEQNTNTKLGPQHLTGKKHRKAFKR